MQIHLTYRNSLRNVKRRVLHTWGLAMCYITRALRITGKCHACAKCWTENILLSRRRKARNRTTLRCDSAANHPRLPKNRKKTARRFASIKITRKFALAKRNWCHSSVGRAKDWKSLCPRFDSWWHHKQEASLKSGALLLVEQRTGRKNLALCPRFDSWWHHLRNASQSLRGVFIDRAKDWA